MGIQYGKLELGNQRTAEVISHCSSSKSAKQVGRVSDSVTRHFARMCRVTASA